jgi:hypothetical protein
MPNRHNEMSPTKQAALDTLVNWVASNPQAPLLSAVRQWLEVMEKAPYPSLLIGSEDFHTRRKETTHEPS